MLIVPRLTTSFDLSETQTLRARCIGRVRPQQFRPRCTDADLRRRWLLEVEAGSGAGGIPISSPCRPKRCCANTKRQDASRCSRSDLVTCRRRRSSDRGAYAQLLWGIKPRIVAGLRGEFANGDDAAFDLGRCAAIALASHRTLPGIRRSSRNSACSTTTTIARTSDRSFALVPVRVPSRRARSAQILNWQNTSTMKSCQSSSNRGVSRCSSLRDRIDRIGPVKVVATTPILLRSLGRSAATRSTSRRSPNRRKIRTSSMPNRATSSRSTAPTC